LQPFSKILFNLRIIRATFLTVVKAICLSFFYLALLTGASAQILIGPEAGGNLSWTRFDDRDLRSQYKVTPIIGYSAGAHLGFRVQKRYFLHLSLIYSTKGRLIEGKTTTVLNHAEGLVDRVRLNYIEMPIIYSVDFKGSLGGNKEFKYSLGAGPLVSYWLGGVGSASSFEIREDVQGGLIDYRIKFKRGNPSPSEMTVSSANRLQLGLNVAGSLIFEPLPARRIMLTVRYELGGTYLSKKSTGTFNGTSYQEPLQSKNKGLRISVAYLFDLKNDQRKKGKSVSDKKKGKNITIRKRR
jgi:hypothetical protein